MRTPLKVEWSYLSADMSENDNDNKQTKFIYQFIYHYDSLTFTESPIKINDIKPFIESFPLTSDYEPPIKQARNDKSISCIEVYPGRNIRIVFEYYTLTHKKWFVFQICKKDEDLFDFMLDIEWVSTYSLDRKFGRNLERRLIKKAEVTDMLSKLPETIGVGIFKLPFGNCFECEPIED